jgi:hypothetical protein
MRPRAPEPLSCRRRLLVRGGILAVVAAIAAGGLYVVAVVPPGDDTYYPKCNFHQLTGLHCPGCGMTRSLHAAVNGHFAQAVAYNLLAPVFLPLVAVTVVRALWSWLWDRPSRGPSGPPRRWSRWVPWVAFGVIVAFGVARNIPVYPFTLLAPHELTP